MCLNIDFKVESVVTFNHFVQLYEPLLPSTLQLNIYTGNTALYIWPEMANKFNIDTIDIDAQSSEMRENQYQKVNQLAESFEEKTDKGE